MPRNSKCRRVCSEPACRLFSPEQASGRQVVMTVEELESLRLCDLEGLDQDAAADRMNVSRGTFQRILYSARRHSAEALVGGAPLLIEGGNYEVAEDCPRMTRGETSQRICRHCRYMKKGERNDE